MEVKQQQKKGKILKVYNTWPIHIIVLMVSIVLRQLFID